MANPRLRVRASNYGGSGYVLPARVGDEFKEVKNADGQSVRARLNEHGKTTVYPGVTTVLDASEAPGIKQWSVDQVVAYCVNNIDALLSRSTQQGFGFARFFWKREPDFDSAAFDPRTWHQGVLSDLAELGTMTHDYCEADLAGEFTPELVNQPQAEMAEQWHLWRAEHTITASAIEMTLFNEELGYAGTLDLIGEVDGEAGLWDIKTARTTGDSHRAQVAALDACTTAYEEDADGFWHEVPIPAYTKHGFIHLRPNDVDNQGNPVPAFCRLEEIDPDELPVHFAAFRGALDRKRAERELQLLRRKKSVIVSAANESEEE